MRFVVSKGRPGGGEKNHWRRNEEKRQEGRISGVEDCLVFEGVVYFLPVQVEGVGVEAGN